MDEMRFLTELYYDSQKMRIMAENRLGQMKRDGLDTERAQELQLWIDERLMLIENHIKKEAADHVKKHEIWDDWLKNIKGIGPIISACLISWISPIERFPTISSLWKYCNLHVVDGKAPKRQKSKKSEGNLKLHTLAWKISDSFVKSGGPYRQEYDRAKTFYRAKFPEKIDTGIKNKKGEPIYNYSDKHIHMMAKRKSVKLFLAHLWVVWRELEGLPVSKPYVIDKLGHTHYLEP